MAGLGAGLLSPTAPARVGGGCQLCDTVLSQGCRRERRNKQAAECQMPCSSSRLQAQFHPKAFPSLQQLPLQGYEGGNSAENKHSWQPLAVQDIVLGTRNALVDLVQEPQHCMWEGL